MGIFYKSKFWNMVLGIDKYFVLLLVLLCASIKCFSEKSYENVSKIEFPIGGEDTLIVKNTNGDIVIHSWKEDSIRIEIKKIVYANSEKEAERLYEKIEIKITKDSSIITLSPEFHIEQASVDFKIHLPEKISLKLHTGNGEIEVKGIHGFVDMVSSNGKIFCSGLSGTVHAHNGNGDIILENISGSVSALTANGDIKCNIENLDVNSNSEVKSTNGDIELSVPEKSNFLIYAHSSNGDIETKIPIYTKKNDVMNENGTKIFVISCNGDIRICKRL